MFLLYPIYIIFYFLNPLISVFLTEKGP